MADVRHQLRAYFDEVDPPFDVAGLMRERQPEPAPTPSGVPKGLVVAAAAAVVVVLVVGLPLLLSGSGPDPAVDPTVTTVPPVTTMPDTTPTVSAMPDYLTDLLACLPLDSTGWAHSEAIPSMGDSRAALAAAGGTAVAVGIDMTGSVEAHWSHDGVGWSPAEGFPDVKVVGESPPAVAGNATGFVAVVVPDVYPGVAPLDHPDTPPIVAFSEDGITWDQLDPEEVPHGVLWLSDVYAGPAGFLITGTITTDRTASGYGASVWASNDGRTWSVADYPVDSWGYPAVVATDTGWAAPTQTGSYEKPDAIWRSADGVTWYETATQVATPDGVGDFRAEPMAVHGRTWVLAGTLQDGRAPTVASSTDDGATWAEYFIGGDEGAEEHATWDIAPTPLGLLMTGRYDFGVDHASLLHHSTDGTNWQLCATPRLESITAAAAGFTEIAMLGDTLLILDSEAGIFHAWNDPGAHP